MSLYLGENLISGQATLVGESRNIGQIIPSAIPLTDAGLHLLDGSLIQGDGIYSAFVDYIADLYNAEPTANYFAQTSYVYADETSEGTAISGGDYSGFPSTNAFDNDISTFWGCSQLGTNIINNAYIGRSGLTYPVKKVRMYQGQGSGNNHCTQLKFQYSNDGANWIDIDTITNGASVTWQEWELPDYTPTGSTHSFRVLAYGGFTGAYNNNWTVEELELYYQEEITAEQTWQNEVTTYGVCGKFVYDSVNNTVRLPKVTGILEGTTDVNALGDLVEAGLPNITGRFWSHPQRYNNGGADGAFTLQYNGSYASSGDIDSSIVSFDASLSNPIYGNSSTVQPQTIKAFYYIVIATSTKTDIQIDIDEVVTDLNGKADVDLSNINASQSAKNEIISWGMPDYNAGVAKANNTDYVADVDGFLVATTNDYNGGQSVLYVNNEVYNITVTNSGTSQLDGSTITMLIPKGTSYKVVFARIINTTKCIFYPLKGAN